MLLAAQLLVVPPTFPYLAWSVAGVLFLALAGALLVGARRARAAAEELEHWRRIFEQVQLAVIRCSPDGTITGWNPEAARWLGHRSEDVLGKGLALFDSPKGLGLSDVLPAALEKGSWTGDLSARRRDGDLVRCESVVLSLRDGRGQVREVVGMHRDVTGQRAEEASRRRLEEQLRQSQKMEAIGQLAGGIAHDFNNLLTSMLGYAEMLGQQFDPESEEAGDLEELLSAGHRAAALTRQMLTFSRRQPQRTAPVDLVRVVEDLTQLLKVTLGEDVRWETHHEQATAWVLAEHSQLEQVLLNLAINARDAMPRGGPLRIETRRRVVLEEQGAADGVCPGEFVEISVRDGGRGMDAETRARVFDPFFTTKEPGKGTGLGLSTVSSMVKGFHGAISVQSEPGVGTCFEILLPRIEPEPGAPFAGSVEVPAGSGETILVVEDEPLVRRLICSGLRQAGYAVLEAASSDEASRLSEVREGPIALLIADVVMPGEGGVEVARRLTATRPDLRVLFISGYTEDTMLAHGLPSKGVTFLRKPFTPAVLQARIATLLASEYDLNPTVPTGA
jgi:two-component system, cell cycle sensor histidine kinase and response regulator CckA